MYIKLTDLPDDLTRLSSLQLLCFEQCQAFVQLPEKLVDLGSLRQLDVDHCASLQGLPCKFGNLTSIDGCSSGGARISQLCRRVSAP